jgi:cytosine/adenosine deaminase-related metal-dependent hydrolase
MKRLLAVFTLTLLLGSLVLPTYAQTVSNYEFNGGWWLDGTTFVRKKLYIVNGVFQKKRPARIDKVIELGDSYIIPPFGDAHSHAFDNPANIDDVVKTNLRDGIF